MFSTIEMERQTKILSLKMGGNTQIEIVLFKGPNVVALQCEVGWGM